MSVTMSSNDKKRRITRTALMLGGAALFVYGVYIAYFFVTAGAL